MSPNLDSKLCESYPEIFRDRFADPKETLMCWGFEHDDGWYEIINQLCSNIQHHVDHNNRLFAKGFKQYKQVDQVIAIQVKEKFGTLRFYYEGGDDVVDGMVRMAESMSAVTCEKCGNTGKLREGGWLRTLCDKHNEERENFTSEI